MSERILLEPDWAQARPSYRDVQLMCQRISLTPISLAEEPFTEFMHQLRESHNLGGAYLAAYDVSPDKVFDWFASRNRLSDDGLVDALLPHATVRNTLPDLAIPESRVDSGLALADPFLLDARFAHSLHHGGAYGTPKGDGRSAKTLAIGVCDAMFGLRYGEIALTESPKAWTPWFRGIAWDLTELVFDKRLRRLWIFAVTDTD